MRPETIAPYVLRALASHQIDGTRIHLEDLANELRIRRNDIRRTVSALHLAGYVDALRMKPTLTGFAVGRALIQAALPPLRSDHQATAAAAA